jgi:hypothetical protein
MSPISEVIGEKDRVERTLLSVSVEGDVDLISILAPTNPSHSDRSRSTSDG